MADWLRELDELQEQLAAFEGADREDEDDGGSQELLQILKDTCAIVRSADAQQSETLMDIVEKAYDILNTGVYMAYGSADLFDFLPSFAHDDETSPVVKDSLQMPFGQGMVDALIPFFTKHFADFIVKPVNKSSIPGPGPWETQLQPSANTSPLSRFRSGVDLSATADKPRANMIYQAQCEIAADNICTPSKLVISTESSFLAVAAAGGWKNRDPVVHYYTLDGDQEYDYWQRGGSFNPGLSDLAHAVALSEDRKLIFVADGHRIKSYSWDEDICGRNAKPKSMHTLQSADCDGDIVVLPGGRIVRAGKGKAIIWDIDQLDIHGPNNKPAGKGLFNPEESWRDNEDGEIELSTGNKPHKVVTFANATLHPWTWHLHAPGLRMLCGESGHRNGTYGCYSLDLEHGGQVATRFLGHGGDVDVFSTSDGDPNIFATAASDGYARLFDVRHPLPAITFNSGKESEACPDVVLVHPDGVPTLFTAGATTQQIKMWDIRARAVVYELGTGNNSVVSMAWDPRTSSLFAATECEYMDRMGLTHDYRRARIPKAGRKPSQSATVVEPTTDAEDDDYMSEEEDEEDEDEDYDGPCWPRKAYHGEDFFGYCYDAGDHTLFRYAFKADADQSQLPAYGQATNRRSFW